MTLLAYLDAHRWIPLTILSAIYLALAARVVVALLESRRLERLRNEAVRRLGRC